MATPGMQNTRTMDAKTTKRGRPRKGQALRVPLTFSVDPATRQKAQELRNSGVELNRIVEAYITLEHCKAFPPKYKQQGVPGAIAGIENPMGIGGWVPRVSKDILDNKK